MEHTALFCPSQTWKGPNVSTFSSEWDDSLNSYLLAPDVIKPPPQFQDPEEPCQSPPSSSTVIKRRDKDRAGIGTSQKERRSRPASAMEPHRRSLSLSTAITSNPAVTRRRCESYALSYPSSSSEDSGSDSTSVRKGDQLPDAVPQSRAHSIVLRKAKRKPAPPVRTVSLHKLTDLKHPERRTQSLYIPSENQNVMLLPDLIPVHKAEAGNSEQSSNAAEAPGKVLGSQPLSSHRPLKELRSSEPCKFSSGPSGGTPIKEATKIHHNSDCNNSPSSSRSSPSQPSISSPSKPPGSASPSSGYSSQCETPTQPVSSITGPSPLGCRMRPKSSSVVPGQRARNNRTRLSLQLPEMQDPRPNPNPEPSPVHPKASRRYSDTSATTRPKQRLSNSMLIMPMVTQEDLNSVRLRSVSSTDLDNAATGVIEEENERDGSSMPAQQSPKAKPPVAPKPPVRKWPPSTVAKSSFGTPSDASPPTSTTSYGQDNIYSTVNKVKSNAIVPQSWNSGIGQEHYQVQQYEFQSQQNVKGAIYPEPLSSSGASNVLPFNAASHTKPSEPHKKRRAPGPPVAKRPDMVYLPSDTSVMDNMDKHVQLASSYSQPGSSQKEYHVTVYGLIPTYPHATEREQPNVNFVPEHDSYHRVPEEGQVPEIGTLQLGGEEDEVFFHKSASHTTEDLFTIIHRSKRKLLGRKDSFDNKQGDLGTQTIGGVSKTSSQNDNFMALLRRTRSAKAGSGSRISATELLKSSKPTAAGAAELTNYKNHFMMQSHSP